ncbi:MAG TPA: glutaconyl-CoA decarboxylase subunit beta, partial [Dehalococcoidia bacterium]|nr:glutaconyl-CoA decarboxylase subunit beta [Dehalococcoidia bacterium]
MIAVGLGFIYLAISKEWEPYELLPIGLGVIVANLPLTGLLTEPTAGAG